MYPSQEAACHSKGVGPHGKQSLSKLNAKHDNDDEVPSSPPLSPQAASGVGFSKDNLYYENMALKCMLQVYAMILSCWNGMVRAVSFAREHSFKQFCVEFIGRPLMTWTWTHRHSVWKTVKVIMGFSMAVAFHTKCVSIAYRRGVIDNNMVGTQRLPDLGQELLPDLQPYRWIPEVSARVQRSHWVKHVKQQRNASTFAGSLFTSSCSLSWLHVLLPK